MTTNFRQESDKLVYGSLGLFFFGYSGTMSVTKEQVEHAGGNTISLIAQREEEQREKQNTQADISVEPEEFLERSPVLAQLDFQLCARSSFQ